MSAVMGVDLALIVLLVALAWWVLAARDAFAAIAGFVAYGLVLMLAWMRLAGPDVALTEGAIGSGLSGLMLFGAAARLRRKGQEAATASPPAGTAMRVGTGLLCAGVVAALAAIVLQLPEPAPTLAPKAAANLVATGLGNPVTGVLLAYRALDTLLEKVGLFLALIGVWSLAPDRAWGGTPCIPSVESNGALRLLAQVLPPFGILVGIHMVWNGADAPGGAFPGSAVLAAMWILALAAGLTRLPAVSCRRLRMAIIIGPAVFLLVAFAGFGLAGAFLAYPDGWAKPLIVAIELPLILSIAVILTLLIAGPPETEVQP